MQIICTICTDLITQEKLENMSITPCGHIFHFHCMIQWIDRSPCCPQCRKQVSKKQMRRVYPTLSEEKSHETELLESLLNDQQNLKAQLVDKNVQIAEMSDELETCKKELDSCQDEIVELKIAMSENRVDCQKQKFSIQIDNINDYCRMSNELQKETHLRHKAKKNMKFLVKKLLKKHAEANRGKLSNKERQRLTKIIKKRCSKYTDTDTTDSDSNTSTV